MTPTMSVVRSLLRELGISTRHPTAASQYRQHILETARRFQVTGQQHCRARDELTSLATTYNTYLSSRRRHSDLLATYRGVGERSIRQTAAMVGLKLPHDPR